MSNLPPDQLERLEQLAKQMADIEARLSPDSVPTAHPWRAAARNSAIVILAIGGAAVISLVALRGQSNVMATPLWWLWFAVGALAVVVFFGHAALGQVIGRPAATNAVGLALVLLSVGFIAWLVRYLNSGGR